jgi:chemotaxis response regulator CheB
VKRKRILLARIPPLMSEMIERILGVQSSCRLVGRVAEGEDLRHAVALNRADVLILGSPGNTNESAMVPDVFQSRPAIVLAVSEGGRDGMLWSLRPEGIRVQELAAATLLAAVEAVDAA